MLPCVYVSVLLVRILTTPTLRFQRPFWNLFHYKSLGVWVYCSARLGVVFPRDHIVDNLQFQAFSSKLFRSVWISWYGKQLITIISDLVPSKKQLSGIGATSLIGGASNTNCLSVCLSVSVCLFLFLSFPIIPYPNSSNGTTEGISATAPLHWRVL